MLNGIKAAQAIGLPNEKNKLQALSFIDRSIEIHQ